MKRSVIQSAWAFIVLAGVLIGSAPAFAAEPAKSSANKKATQGRVGKVTFLHGSEETSQERNARLKRECKGRVNAGACEGYTR